MDEALPVAVQGWYHVVRDKVARAVWEGCGAVWIALPAAGHPVPSRRPALKLSSVWTPGAMCDVASY